jgi:hypothetical protein
MEKPRASYAIYVCDVQQGLKSHPNDRVKAAETENLRGCQALTVQKINNVEAGPGPTCQGIQTTTELSRHWMKGEC